MTNAIEVIKPGALSQFFENGLGQAANQAATVTLFMCIERACLRAPKKSIGIPSNVLPSF